MSATTWPIQGKHRADRFVDWVGWGVLGGTGIAFLLGRKVHSMAILILVHLIGPQSVSYEEPELKTVLGVALKEILSFWAAGICVRLVSRTPFSIEDPVFQGLAGLRIGVLFGLIGIGATPPRKWDPLWPYKDMARRCFPYRSTQSRIQDVAKLLLSKVPRTRKGYADALVKLHPDRTATLGDALPKMGLPFYSMVGIKLRFLPEAEKTSRQFYTQVVQALIPELQRLRNEAPR